MNRILGPLVLSLIALPLPLAAQSGGGSASGMVETLTDPAAIGDAASEAAELLGEKAKHKLLASEMIGRDVTGPGGDTIGTVEDLVVVPGGKVVAILVKPPGGQSGKPVALPYQALKVSAAGKAAGKAGLSLPVGLDEARGIKGMQALTEAVTAEGG